MSTSDQQEHGPLTRKQLREIRLTGSTPVITAEEAAEAAAEAAARTSSPVPPLPRAAEPAEVAPAPVADSAVDLGAAPLTRRQAREHERIRTASVPVIGAEEDQAEEDALVGDVPVEEAPVEAPVEEVPLEEAPLEEVPVEETSAQDASAEETSVEEIPVEEESAIVSAVPVFGDSSANTDLDDDRDDDVDDEVVAAPVSAASAVDSVSEAPEREEGDADEVFYDVEAAHDADVVADERPTISSAFGQGVLAGAADKPKPFVPSFDELLTVGDSNGSQHLAPNTLIFTPSPGDGSLSGPVASTGEILVTGSYELPQGLGSQGHAHGTTDGREADAVLIDGELPPASSPTPIAASSAVSTLKPAGEVIRPPAPEKGNKLMLTLAITAGGLALALAVALVVAFNSNVF